MTHTRPLRSWARLTAPGIPALTVIRRPLRIDQVRILDVGAVYPAPAPGNFAQCRRARQLYEQRRIAPLPEVAATQSAVAPAQAAAPQSTAPQSVSDPSASDQLPDEASARFIPEAHDDSFEEAEELTEQDEPRAEPKKTKKKGNHHGT